MCKIVIFSDHSECYIYKTHAFSENFVCIRCPKTGCNLKRSKRVNAFIYQNEAGEDYVELSDEAHYCKPGLPLKTFQSSEFELRSIPKLKKPHLFLRNHENRNDWYKFSWCSENSYRCSTCLKCRPLAFKKDDSIFYPPVMAFMLGNPTDGYYLKVESHPHSCQPVNEQLQKLQEEEEEIEGAKIEPKQEFSDFDSVVIK